MTLNFKESGNMQILEYGNSKNPKIILIHGLECPYQIWTDYINYYQDKFHIIVPILPGHNPEQLEKFTSFENITNQLEEYYIPKYGKEVYAIYGLSMGGIIASIIWQNKNVHIQNLILESAPLLPTSPILTTFITKQYVLVTNLIKKRNSLIIKIAQKTIIPKEKLKYFLKLIDNISITTLTKYSKTTCKYQLAPNINTLKTKLYYIHGTKITELLSKSTAKYIKKNYPNSQIITFKGKNHCENTLLHPTTMIKELNKILK